MSRVFFDNGQHLAVGLPAMVPPFAVSFWFRPDDTTSDHPLWLGDNLPAVQQTWSLVAAGTVDGSPVRLMIGSDTVAESAAGFTTGWNHVLAVLTAGGEHCLYLNGEKIRGTTAQQVALRTMYVGSPTPDIAITGVEIGELALWTAALNDGDARSLSRALCPMRLRRTSLVGYWPLGGLFGRNDRDFSSHGYHLTSYNRPKFAEHPPVIYGHSPLAGNSEQPPSREPCRTTAGRVWHPGALAGVVYG